MVEQRITFNINAEFGILYAAIYPTEDTLAKKGMFVYVRYNGMD
jgi:hypothetical protein